MDIENTGDEMPTEQTATIQQKNPCFVSPVFPPFVLQKTVRLIFQDKRRKPRAREKWSVTRDREKNEKHTLLFP